MVNIVRDSNVSAMLAMGFSTAMDGGPAQTKGTHVPRLPRHHVYARKTSMPAWRRGWERYTKWCAHVYVAWYGVNSSD